MHARRRTAALRHERRAPRRRARRGELSGDQNGGGRSTDGDGDKVEAAEKIGSTAATVLRRSSATTKGRTRTATTCRPRWRPPRATATAGATATTAALGHTALELFRRRETKARVAAGRGDTGGPYIGVGGRRRRPTAAGDAKETSGKMNPNQTRIHEFPKRFRR